MSECGWIDCCPVDGLNERIKELQKRLEQVETVLNQHHFGDSVPKVLIRQALENDDEN